MGDVEGQSPISKQNVTCNSAMSYQRYTQQLYSSYPFALIFQLPVMSKAHIASILVQTINLDKSKNLCIILLHKRTIYKLCFISFICFIYSLSSSTITMETNGREYGYIVRIDQPKHTLSKGTHGWQVRFPTGEPRKYHSKLFSDNIFGSKEEALEEAETYLEECRETLEYSPPESDHPCPRYALLKGKLQANNSSGRTGVFRTHAFHGQTGKKQEYWGAFCPLGPDGQRNKWTKRFYVNSHGEDEARRLAIEFRNMWEDAADNGEEAIKQFFEEYHEAVV